MLSGTANPLGSFHVPVTSRCLFLIAALIVPLTGGVALAQCGNAQKLLADDGMAADWFGTSVSVSGDVAVVGATGDGFTGTNPGAAYVFRRDGTQWRQEAKLVAKDGTADAMFGNSVFIDGDVIVIGARGDTDRGTRSGSAYVFRLSSEGWVEEQKLLADDGMASDIFGMSVSVCGDVALVGAHGNDDRGSNSGSAYIFRFDQGVWRQEQKLVASDGAAGDWFGWSVSVSDQAAIIGAVLDDDNGLSSGSAYVFRFDGTEWLEEQKLLASDGARNDWFAGSVSISADVILIGADRDDDRGSNSGSAYAFRRNGAQWVQEQKLLAGDLSGHERFGVSVFVSGEMAVVGAFLDDDNGVESGSAYTYRWQDGDWIEVQKLLAYDGAAGEWFGVSVSASGDIVLIGAPGEGSQRTNHGAGYVFPCKDFAPGDLNCDGEINAFDIEPFLLALFDPDRYPMQYPDCDLSLADVNADGSINAFDIEPFLGLLFP